MPQFNTDLVNKYEAMRTMVKAGTAKQWQATEIFRYMTYADMNEILRRRKLEKSEGK